MSIDPMQYLPYLDGEVLTEEERLEVIHSYLRSAQAFVDRAFGEHPAQLAGGTSVKADSRGCPLAVDCEASCSMTDNFDRARRPPPEEDADEQ
ncbi:MAG: hypothetical protein AAGE83_09850 [Pseudomonadota bacterium]